MKKITAVILTLAMLLCAVPFSSGALSESRVFADTTDISDISAVGADVSYDGNYGMLRASLTGTSASITIPSLSLEAGKSAVVTLLCAYTNSAAFTGVTAECGTDSFAVGATGYKFYSTAHTLSSSSQSLSLSFTGTAGDYILVDSVVCTDDAQAAVSGRQAAANGAMNGYSESELDCSAYDAEKYTESFYEGNIVYGESVFCISEPDGSIAPRELMYTPDRIVSVRDAKLNINYVYGKDWTIVDGKFQIIAGGAIRMYKYTEVFPSIPSDRTSVTLDGGYVDWAQDAKYFSTQLFITYTHTDVWDGVVTPGKSLLIPRVTDKLANGEPVHICFLGDSITGGANSSSYRNVSPYAEWWNVMTVRRLQILYPDSEITYCIHSKGGAGADWAADEAKVVFNSDPEKPNQHAETGSDTDDDFAYDSAYVHNSPDVVVLGFGANDAMNGDAPETFKATIVTAIEGIQATSPDCDIILTASMICNIYRFPIQRFVDFAKCLYEVEADYDNVAVADLTTLHKYLLTFKSYLDMTGDNMCHPNDFMARILAQVTVQTLTAGDLGEYSSALAKMLSLAADPDDYRTEQKTMLAQIIAGGSEALANSSADDLTATYISYLEQIEALPTNRELTEAAADYSTMIFNTPRKINFLKVYDLDAQYSEEERMAKLTVLSNSDPRFTIDFSAAVEPLKASDYTHVVMVFKNPTTNSKRALNSTFEFFVNGSTITESHEYLVAGRPVLSDEYQSFIIDVSAEDWWQGELTGMRFDPYARGTAGDVFYLDSIQFVNGAEAAQAAAQTRIDALNAPQTAESVIEVFGNEQLAKASLGTLPVLYTCGDANGDGVADARDALAMRRNFSGYSNYLSPVAADTNRDGYIDARDVLALRRIIVGRADEFGLRLTSTGAPADVTYSAAVKSSALVDNGLNGDTSVVYRLASETVTTDIYRYMIITYRADSATDFVGAIGEEFSANAELVADGEFHNLIIELPETVAEDDKRLEEVLFTYTMNGGESLYLNSVSFAADMEEAQTVALIRLAAANA